MAIPKSIAQLLTPTKQDRSESNSLSTTGSTTLVKSQTSQAVIELRQRFGEHPGKIMAAFNPDKQVDFCRHVDRCYFGTAPSIGLVKTTYGSETAENWLIIQLNNLSEFAGCKEKLKPHQLVELALMIIEGYGYFKLTEFMLFFQRFKRCVYGKFYGAVDPMVIMAAIEEFAQERRTAYIQKEQKEEQERRDREHMEWEQMRERYRQRIPNAFKENQVLTFTQYRLLGYDYMTDEQIAQEMEALQNGTKEIAKDRQEMIDFLQQLGMTD